MSPQQNAGLTPEQQARAEIDRLLIAAGWDVCDLKQANILASRGVAIRNFTLADGYGFADYLLYVDGKAAGVIEAKRQGATLSGVETQSGKYSKGLSESLPAWKRPLPFLYESTGIETRFTNGLDPEPRSRRTFAFHRPDTLADWLASVGTDSVDDARGSPIAVSTGAADGASTKPGRTFLERLKHMPPLADNLWPPKPKAIANLERSLRKNRPRALVQMATGSGKTLQRGTEFRVMTSDGVEVPILDVAKRGSYHREVGDDPEQSEYFVSVEWIKTVPAAQAIWELGFFGNQNSVCKPTKPRWRSTVERLKERFGVI